MPQPADIARLESALDRAARRARMATARGDWHEAETACREAEGLREALGAARRTEPATNVVGRRRVNG